MKKEFLIELGIAEDVAAKIMAENGKDIQREQNKFADYEDLKKSLADSQDALTKLQSMKPEELQGKIAELNKQLETVQAESAKKIADMEATGKVKDFLGSYKFVNDLTRDSIADKLKQLLTSEEAKGKDIKDIYTDLTKDMKNIVVDENAPKPPVQQSMTANAPTASSDDAAVRAVMGLPPLKE